MTSESEGYGKWQWDGRRSSVKWEEGRVLSKKLWTRRNALLG